MKDKKLGTWIHEGAFDKFYVSGQDDPILNTMKESIRIMRLVADRCAATTETILKNEMQTRVKNMRDAASFNYAQFMKASPSIDKAAQIAKSEIARIIEETKAPASTPYDFEVRATLKSMSQKDRETAIEKAIADGDDAVVAAVLYGPSMLSGIPDSQRELYRERWRAKRFPQDLDRQRRLEGALKVLHSLSKFAMDHVLALTDAESVRRAEASEIEARAAINAA
jgi:hypothetical protein